MPSANKKGTTVPVSVEIEGAWESMSKAAIFDCLVDALSANPEELTLAELAEHCNPRLLVRGDKPLKESKR